MKSTSRVIQQYERDGRAPIPEKAVTSRIMSSIKGKDTKPEIILRKELWRIGVRGYRLHSKKVIGKPDISFLPKKVAVFVNGCFWHRCPFCQLSLPKVHTVFWQEKFEKNMTRDKRNVASLEALGWKVLTVWECQVLEDVKPYATEIMSAISRL